MPLHTYVCGTCRHQFETLVRSGESVVCPECGGGDLARQLGAIAPEARSPGLIKAGRRQAAREGHFTNYSRSERPKL